MEKRFVFSLSRLMALPAAEAGQRVTYHDTKVHYLKCRVTDHGTKTLIVSAKVGGRAQKAEVHRLRGDGLDPTMETLRLRARERFQELEARAARPARRCVPTFGEYLDTWAESAEMQRATAAWRESKLACARTHCKDLMGLKLDKITRADTRTLITSLCRRGLRGVPRIVRSIVNQIYELAIDNEVLPEDHSVPLPRNLKLPRYKRDRRLTGEELARLFAALLAYEGHDRSDADSLRLIVLMALFTAQRQGNILQMRWDEIDNVNHIWSIPAAKAKTRREYRVPIHDDLWILLQAQREHLMRSGRSSPWVFPSYADRGQPTVNINRPWAWLMKTAQLADFRFHDLRHSAASIAYESSQDLKGTQMFLQHADSRTTADRYIHTVDVGPQVRASGAVIAALCNAIGMNGEDLRGKLLGG